MKNKSLTAAIVALIVVVAVVAVVVTHGKSSDDMTNMNMSTSQSATSSGDQTASTDSVTIKEYMFTPAKITVKAGTTVTWTNQDAVEHNIVADTPSSDAPNGPLFGQGKTYSFTFKKAGTYTYHCMPHPYMKGTVEVTN